MSRCLLRVYAHNTRPYPTMFILLLVLLLLLLCYNNYYCYFCIVTSLWLSVKRTYLNFLIINYTFALLLHCEWISFACAAFIISWLRLRHGFLYNTNVRKCCQSFTESIDEDFLRVYDANVLPELTCIKCNKQSCLNDVS